ncbi:MAG: hypothetical protein L6R41_001466 [Letrouitia leprolyta]|nr:MAG: hypothetical protein L6R41_001466 [Letrouitia leprolyta]
MSTTSSVGMLGMFQTLFYQWLGFASRSSSVNTPEANESTDEVPTHTTSFTMHEVVRGDIRAWMTKAAFNTLEKWFATEECNATLILSRIASKDPSAEYELYHGDEKVLFSAAEKEALAIYLLNKGAEPGSALPKAAALGNIFLVKLLHGEEVDLDTKDEEFGSTALIAACVCGPSGGEAVVDFLCAQGCNIEATGPDGMTPLGFAVSTDRISIVKLLCNKGVNLEAIGERKETPLHYACQLCNHEIADYLCLQGANIEALDCNAKTPLMFAASYGRLEIVKLLCTKGASIEDMNVEGLNALMYASRDGHESVVSFLLEQGAKIESQDYHGRTPLIHASRQGQASIVRYLCSRGAKIETRDDEGSTALLYAAKNGHPKSAQALCDRSADLEHFVASNEGVDMNALMIACASDNAHLVQILCRQGANINAHNVDGYTALMHACKNGHARIVQLLCSKGARVLDRATDGKTAYQRVDDKNPDKAKIVRILDKHNVEVMKNPTVVRQMWVKFSPVLRHVSRPVIALARNYSY